MLNLCHVWTKALFYLSFKEFSLKTLYIHANEFSENRGKFFQLDYTWLVRPQKYNHFPIKRMTNKLWKYIKKEKQIRLSAQCFGLLLWWNHDILIKPSFKKLTYWLFSYWAIPALLTSTKPNQICNLKKPKVKRILYTCIHFLSFYCRMEITVNHETRLFCIQKLRIFSQFTMWFIFTWANSNKLSKKKMSKKCIFSMHHIALIIRICSTYCVPFRSIVNIEQHFICISDPSKAFPL